MTRSKFSLKSVLNLSVRETLAANFELFLVFSQNHPGLDDDIEPTHNKEWVAGRQQLEQELLEACLRTLDQFRRMQGPSEHEQVEWVEGAPTKPGSYWFLVVRGGRAEFERGRTAVTGDGSLVHIGDDFIYGSDLKSGRVRLWYMPLKLPPPPVFDRKCSDCGGTGRKHGLESTAVLQQALGRGGWSLDNFDLDLVGGTARVELHCGNLHLVFDARNGRCSTTREIVEWAGDARRYRSHWSRHFLGRTRHKDVREGLGFLSHYLAENGLAQLPEAEIRRAIGLG